MQISQIVTKGGGFVKRAITVRFLCIIFLTGMISGGVSAGFASVREEQQAREAAVQMCRSLAHVYSGEVSAEDLSEILGGQRVTILLADGTVADDSESDEQSMKNHADRPEIRNARVNYVATDSRVSPTLGRSFMYAALVLPDGNFLRVAVLYDGLMHGLLRQVPVFLAAFLVAGLVSALVARFFSGRIVEPLHRFTDGLAAGDMETLVSDPGYYEIERILSRLRGLVHELDASRREAELQWEKTDYILSTISDGFLLLDKNEKILLINPSAKEILQVHRDVKGCHIVEATRVAKILEATGNVVSEQESAVFDLHVSDRVFSVHISPVAGKYTESGETGAAVLLMDVSADRLSQRQRSEFFSNASHELKTPITTVLGLSELLESGLLGEADVSEESKRIVARIHAETKRIHLLVNDILTISRLEAGIGSDPEEVFGLEGAVREAVASLLPVAEMRDIRIDVSCEEVEMFASRRRIRELLVNLLENAIRYNLPSGSVSVSVKRKEIWAQIVISDTGIGIPMEAQSRVFERFFRVDAESHRAVKGTGLGLSIVKHIVSSFGGEIHLRSQIDVGTSVTVLLPIVGKADP